MIFQGFEDRYGKTTVIADGKYGNFLIEFDFVAFEPLALRAETIIDLISLLFYPRLLQYPVV